MTDPQRTAAALVAACVLFGTNAAAGEASQTAHLARLEQAAAEHPKDPAPALQLAAGHAARGDVESTLRWTTVAAGLGAHPVRISLLRGDAYAAAQRWEPAITEYFESALGAPENLYAHLRLWDVVRRADPTTLDGGLDLGRVREVLRARGMPVPARLPATDDPAGASEQLAQGYEALRTSLFPEASRRFGQAADLAPSKPDAWRGLALALTHLGRPDEALGAYALFVHLSPKETVDVRRARQLIVDAERHRGLEKARSAR